MDIKIGIEKECLVFDDNLKPVDIDIDNLAQEYTVDFANHQLEVVTQVKTSSNEVTIELDKLFKDKYFLNKNIWPLSIPMIDNKHVLHNKVDSEYRNKLAQKYELDKMLNSGVHYNYSNSQLTTKEDYFQLAQKIFEFMPIIIQFTSFSPFAHKPTNGLEKVGKNYGFKNSLSLRASEGYGYANGNNIKLDFQSFAEYEKSKLDIIQKGLVIDEREIYSKIRLKTENNKNYIELRFLDLNPFTINGISEETLILLEVALDYLTTKNLNSFNYELTEKQVEQMTLNGRDKTISLKIDNKQKTVSEHTNSFLETLINYTAVNTYKEVLYKLKVKYNTDHLDIDLMCDQLVSEAMTLQQFGIQHMHKVNIFNELLPHLDMELSTKLIINEAQNRKYDVTIESESQNIIKVSNDEKFEYIIQATKTNLDPYASVLLMNDKYMTKKILAENKICVPQGIKLQRNETLTKQFIGDIVVKPLDTNFGQGITICDGENQEEVNDAIKRAFAYSDEVIIEQFAKGDEHRFLVINGNVESIVTRKNANIIGDGVHTINELINQKNNSELRGFGYKRPLEKIVIDDDLKNVIKKQGYELESIVVQNEKVLLRSTTNVSQGGDSYEVYDIIKREYKKVAIKAAKVLGVKICGVDMIIDFETGKYSIIEVNFNPALHMHMYPFKGKGRNVAKKVLDALFEKENN